MSPAPFELPIKASEAATLADITFQLLENRRLQEDLRNRLAARAAGLGLSSIRPHWGSLQQDPVHAASYYLAVDGLAAPAPQPLLLRLALASAPASGLFPNATLIGRMRPGGGREVVVNAVNFGPGDIGVISTFATKVDRTFLPRPQGIAPAITVTSGEPEKELPAAFEGFRAAQRNGGINMASIAAAPGLGKQTLASALWSAIRTGWRDGYNLEAEPFTAGGADSEALRDCALFTRFRTALTRSADAASAGSLDWAIADFGMRFTVGDERFQFESPEVTALVEQLGGSLCKAERLFDDIRAARQSAGFGRVFDFELVLPEDLDVRGAFFCLHWLRSRGRPVTLLAPALKSVEEAKQYSAVARHFGSTLSFDADILKTLPHPGQWTGGRWNCRVKGKITAERIQSTAAALRA